MTDLERRDLLPPDTSILRENVAGSGWFAYYFDPEEKAVYAFPMVIWATVEYQTVEVDANDNPIAEYPIHEIRPFVLTRSGKVIDAQEPEQDFLCILGPGFEHLDMIKRLLQQRYPNTEVEEQKLKGILVN